MSDRVQRHEGIPQWARVDRTGIDPARPAEGTLEARAAFTFKVLAAFNVAGAVLALFPPITPVSLLHAVVFNLAALALAGLYLIAALAIDRGRPWAVAAARPLLVLVLAAGVYLVFDAFTHGRIRVPYDVVLVVWAWLGERDATRLPRPDGRSVALAAGSAALLAVMLFAQVPFGWGGSLDVHEPDLTTSIAASCTEAGAGGLPATITLTYDWSWARRTPLPSGVDMVAIGWTGSDAEARPLYVIDDIPDSGRGIHSGRQGYPSAEMAKAAARESEGSFRWALDLGQQGLAPGRIELTLRRAQAAPPSPEPLTVRATYVHLGAWREDAAKVTCAW